MTTTLLGGKAWMDGLTRSVKAFSLKSASIMFPEKIVRMVMSQIKIGCIEVETPDNGYWTLGDPNATLRCRVRVKNKALFPNLVRYWDIGLGESFQAGHYEVDDLNVAFLPGISGSTQTTTEVGKEAEENVALHRDRGNTLGDGSKANIAYHYDLSNELYSLFLDPSMAYSSAVYRSKEDTLHEAQINKFDVLCKKLELKATDHVLEIGSGWGGFAMHAAGKYGCRVTTITLSKEQKTLADQLISEAGLSDKIEVRLQDYREVTGSFDKICSIEMFEAVGYEFFDAFFAKCREVLKPNGVMAMQVITIPDHRFDAYKNSCDWIQKQIFPGCLLPSIFELGKSIRNSGGLLIQHIENYDLHYARTLKEWRQAFHANYDKVKALGFDDTFFRTWDYYLAYCEASFRYRNISLLQMTMTFPNNLEYKGPNFLEI
jgi:cyclopropane-fatty-acyl-phospholipid synthase